MKYLLLSLLFVLMPFCLLAQAPPLPGLFYEDELDTGDEGTLEGGEATEESTPEEEISYEIVDLSPYFSMLDWSAWDNEVRAWFETCNTYASMVPPLPLGVRYSFSLDTRECTPPFDVVCSHFASVDVDDIQTWGIRVEEQIDAYGTRTFCTLIGRTILRKIAVDPSFDPTAWILSTYEPPEWLYENEEQTNYWFQTHDRSRFIMSFTVVPTGQLSSYNALMATLAAEEQQHRVELQKDPTVFSFQKMNPSTLDVLFEFYNPLHVSLILLMKKELSEPWNLYGRVGENTTDGLGYTAFTAPRNLDHDKGFYLIVDGSTDSDGDGLPDGLELNYFKSDPQKRDTRFSGLSDWEKVYIYGLSPAERDADGDGLIDGEEIRLGTNPQKADTDEDGLTDGMEVNSLQPIEYFTWINPSETATQLPLTNATVTLSSPITMKEASYNKVLVDATGKITLASQEDASVRGPTISAQEVLPLLYDVDASSSCLFEETTYNGVTCFVFTFKNLYVVNDISSNGTNLQIVLTPSTSNYFGISYLSVSKTQNETDGFVASIKNQHQSELARYPQNGAITSQCSLVGRLGYGTNPLKADTDDDGLNDALEVLTVYSNPLVADTDEDRLSDGDEYHKHFTNPLNADTDSDTLPDWWEVQYGIDPLSASGINGKDGDPDGDTIINKDELRYSTHPASSDTDNDGLSDVQEIGHISIETSNISFSSEGKQTLLSSSQNEDSLGATINLQTPVCIKHFTYSKIFVSLDGRLLLSNDEISIDHSLDGSNGDLFNNTSFPNSFIVAAYWDDLYYYADLSDIYLTETNEAYILHYDNVGIVGSDTSVQQVGTFKIVLPKTVEGAISFHYRNLSSAFNGESATIGIRTATILEHAPLTLQYAYNVANSISNNLALRFDLGVCTSPINPDTDGDGLLDGQEISLNASPFSADTDGDGLPDAWEAKYGLDLFSPDGIHGARGDADNDGLKNSEEYAIKTSPIQDDTDGDTFSDAEEYGTITALTGHDWLHISTLSNVAFYPTKPNVEVMVNITFNGVTYTRMSINQHGRIDLYTEMTPPQDVDSQGPIYCKYRASGSEQILLAPASSFLTFKDETSSISKGEYTYQGVDYYIVEYKHMGLVSDVQGSSLNLQVLIPKQITPQTPILFNYGALEGALTGAALSVGFVSPVLKQGRTYCHEEPNALLSNQTLGVYLGYNTSPTTFDTDYDGLSDFEEYTHATNPTQPDSDGDNLLDVWEIKYGFSATVSNNRNNDGIDGNRYDEDPDNDGLTNLEEQVYHTNPLQTDSDGDGVNDNDELEQWSYPLDASDNGAPTDGCKVVVHFGDWSGSCSEKYALFVRPVGTEDKTSYHLVNSYYGSILIDGVLLKPNVTYEFILEHSSSFLPSPDLDYALDIRVPDGYFYRIEEMDDFSFGYFEDTEWEQKDRQFKLTIFEGRILHDVNRDGKIEETVDGAPQHYIKKTLYHWSNDDYDQGNCSDENGATDIPCGNQGLLNINDLNFRDSIVNGRADLLDFAPIWIDIEKLINKWPISEGYIYKLSSECEVGIVFTTLSKGSVSTWHTSDITCFAKNGNNTISYESPVYTINSEGMILSEDLIENFTSGVCMLEGQEPGGGRLKFTVSRGEEIFSEATLNFSILDVESMCRNVDLTSFPTTLPSPKEPTLPDAYFEEDAPYLFFIHGFRVDERDAKGWHAEMFKRLWQSGAEINYVAVTWSGCEGLLVAINYHGNVYNAFQTGAAFADLLKQMPQNKRAIVMAHSLGNMVAASAFKFYDASCETFIMLNAAIPTEAFFDVGSDAATFEDLSDIEKFFVPEEWRNYPCRLWSTHWHQLFPYDEEAQAYPREHSYTWKSLFSDINQKVGTTYNFYSSEDEVFELAESIETSFTGFDLYFNFGIYVDGIFPWVHSNVADLEVSRYAWQKQEILKGRSRLAGTTTGGWKFSAAYEGDTEEAIRAARINASDEQLKQTPVFSTNGIEFILDPSEYEESEYYKLLAYAMPALSPAMGRPYIQGIEGTDMIDFKKELGRDHNIYKSRWLHSDVKDMAYFYVKTLFDEFALIINGEK